MMLRRERIGMKKKILLYLASFLVTLSLVSLGQAAEVSQGRCIAYDRENGLISIEEYDINFTEAHRYGGPTGKVSVFNVSNALIGIPPEVGDILRIAYNIIGAEKMALRVMNVSKQDLRKK
jgi:hypothetical protein